MGKYFPVFLTHLDDFILKVSRKYLTLNLTFLHKSLLYKAIRPKVKFWL